MYAQATVAWQCGGFVNPIESPNDESMEDIGLVEVLPEKPSEEKTEETLH